MKNGFIARSIIKSFTLVEILVVLAIMGILLGISLPALEKIMKGQGVEAGVRAVSGKLSLARSNAITNNARVALLFPDSTVASANVPADFKNFQIRVCIVTYDSTANTYTFLRWIEGEIWYKLPTGVAFDNLASAFTIKDVEFSDVNASTTSAKADIPGIIFNAYGSLDVNPPADKTILVYQNNGGATTAAAATNKMTVTLRSFTGKMAYSEQ